MIEINLIKESKKRRKGIGFNLQGVVPLVFVALVGAIILEVVVLGIYTYELGKRVNMLEAERNRLKKIEVEVGKMRAKLRQVKAMTEAIKKLSKNRGLAARILKDFADVMPQGLWLVKLEKRNNIVNIEGKSFTAEAVAQYMTNLGNIAYVKKVRFSGNGLVRLKNKNAPNVYMFYISVMLKD